MIKPVEPGPACTPAEQSQYAQDMAKWTDWVREHPEEAQEADSIRSAPQSPASTPQPKYDEDD
jgi:hypothetical protein